MKLSCVAMWSSAAETLIAIFVPVSDVDLVGVNVHLTPLKRVERAFPSF